MKHSDFDFRNLKDTNKAQGYVILTRDIAKRNHTVDSTVYFSAGAIYSTTPDLYKWARAIANHQLLKDTSWQRAFTPFMNNYGYGFFVDSLLGKNFVRHSGGLLGFMSEYIYFPGEDVTIILLNNIGNYGGSLFPVAFGIASIVFHSHYSNWQQDSVTIHVDESMLKKCTGTYEYSSEHQLIVTFKNDNLYVEATDPKDKLPRVQLWALSDNLFYIKEAQLKFDFIKDANGVPLKVLTYITENKKDEWRKIK